MLFAGNKSFLDAGETLVRVASRLSLLKISVNAFLILSSSFQISMLLICFDYPICTLMDVTSSKTLSLRSMLDLLTKFDKIDFISVTLSSSFSIVFDCSMKVFSLSMRCLM